MRALSFVAAIFPMLVATTPLPAPNPEPLQATAFADFPVNVIMTAGAAQFGMWVPHDGVWYSAATLRCLNAGANSYGACSVVSYDHVGVVAGNGPCTFFGTNGWLKTLAGNAGDGFTTIAPPQQLAWVSCGP